MKRALVVGANGQDGRLLLDRLSRDSATLGLDVGSAAQRSLDDFGPFDPLDLQSREHVQTLIGRLLPDEIYYLAAHHHSSEEQPDELTELGGGIGVHIAGLAHVLDSIRERAPRCRLFYAGSSQMFGRPAATPQDETTPFAPRNAYAITKVAGAHLCALYRERYAVHASVGILYNHESRLRGPRFVSQRIARGARAASRDPAYKLRLGSLSATVDWCYAPDYVDAMTRIVSQSSPDDYVIATGEPHTVRDFVEVAFACLGLDFKLHVEEDTTLVKAAPAVLVGDAARLRARTGWRPTVSFEEMVGILVHAAE